MIRKFKFKDIDKVANLIKDFLSEKYPQEKTIIEDIRDSLKVYSGSNIEVGAFVFEEDGEILAVLAYSKMPKPFNLSETVLSEDFLFVDIKYRNSRIGPQLINEFIKFGYKLKVNNIQLCAVSDNTLDRLTNFYNKKGFKQLEVIFDRQL